MSRSAPSPAFRRAGGPAGVLTALAVLLLPVVAFLAGCDSAEPKVKMPARVVYMEGEALENQQLYSEAATKFQEVADQNPGTLLGSFALLKMGDLYFRLEDWEKAETNYRLFLTANQNSHLTSYVLYRLIVVQHQNSYSGLLFPARDIERNMEPNRRIIREYQRFFFLFPQSTFLEDSRRYFRAARDSLAAHEHMVADFYFERGQYNAAASRYLYLLKQYPFYPKSEAVLNRLLDCYRRNQQPELAEELERVYKFHSQRLPGGGQSPVGAAGPDDSARAASTR